MILSIDDLAPYVRYVRLNTSSPSPRSFVDPEYVLSYIRRGRGVFVVEGVEYPVQAGDVCLLSPYMLHIVWSEGEEGLQQCVIHFDLFYRAGRRGNLPPEPQMTHAKFRAKRNNPEALLQDAPILQTSVPGEAQNRIYRQFRALWQSFRNPDAPYRLLRERAAMLDILAQYLSLTPQTAHQQAPRSCNWRNIERALAFIHANYGKPLTLEQISREAWVSPTYLCAIFRKRTGLPVHRYLCELRMYKAKRLMEDTQMSLTDIAQQTGFGSIHAFSKAFRKCENMTPSQYRQSSSSLPDIPEEPGPFF